VVTDAVSVARLTLAVSTPGTWARAFSTRPTQEAQLMPVTPKRKLAGASTGVSGSCVFIADSSGRCTQPGPSHHGKVKASFAVAGVRLGLAVRGDQLDGVGLHAAVGHFHARGTGRHAGHGEAAGLRTIREQALDVFSRHVAFDEIAVHLGGVAGALGRRD